jgi:hypothetical protein
LFDDKRPLHNGKGADATMEAVNVGHAARAQLALSAQAFLNACASIEAIETRHYHETDESLLESAPEIFLPALPSIDMLEKQLAESPASITRLRNASPTLVPLYFVSIQRSFSALSRRQDVQGACSRCSNSEFVLISNVTQVQPR